MTSEVILIVNTDGTITTIYEDCLQPVLACIGGPWSIRRASHVEPREDGFWQADMRPVGGPMLEPTLTRQESLEKERDWLLAHDIPVPQEARSSDNIPGAGKIGEIP